MRRPVFRRGIDYVAVRPIRMTDGVIRVGEIIPPRFSVTFRRRKAERHIAGPVGHPWTDERIAQARRIFGLSEEETAIREWSPSGDAPPVQQEGPPDDFVVIEPGSEGGGEE